MSANRFRFRAWDKGKGEWIHKEPCNLIGENILMGGWLDTIPIERFDDVVCLQSTGLTDKNGKEIFEGDVVKGIAEYSQVEDTYEFMDVVMWDKDYSALTLTGRRGYVKPPIEGYLNFMHQAVSMEVIGNIYENPELLEATK